MFDKPSPQPLILLDGRTGTGKTELIRELSVSGVPTIDLEGLALHRGSVFTMFRAALQMPNG